MTSPSTKSTFWIRPMLFLGAMLLSTVFAQTQISVAFWGQQSELDIYQQLKEQFEAQNPDIQVNLQQIDSGEYEQRILIQYASDTAPDVMTIRDASSSFFARRGLFQDLTPLIEAQGFDLSDFDEATLEMYRHEGQQYGIPRSITPIVTYYNKALFDEAGVAYPEEGWTWDDFLETAQALTRDTNGDGAPDVWGTFMVPWDALFLPIVITHGGSILNEEGTEATLTRPETIEAFTYANDLINTHNVAPPLEAAYEMNWIDGWAQGRYAMIFQGRWATPIFLDAMENTGATFEFDVAPVPQGALRQTIQYSDALGILSTSTEPEAAFRFIAFLSSEEGQQVLGGPRSLVVPSNLNVAESLISPDAMPENARLFLTEAEYGVAPPQSPSFSALYEIINRNLSEIFLGLVSVEDGLATANQEVNEMLEDAYESLQ